MAATAVTPTGVRDGDPDALAGLCVRRGSAVIAYCEVVAGPGAAAAAAAEAFGSFRAEVVAAGDLGDVNPEALLISATRNAAARHAGSDAPTPCAGVPTLLAGRADRSITLADHDWLEQHLQSCWTCRAPVARFEAADRAYRDPPAGSLEPEVAAMIVAALAAAAPVRGSSEEADAVLDDGAGEAASTNGSAAAASPGAEHGGGDVTTVDQPTAAYQMGDVDVDVKPDEPPPDAGDDLTRPEPTAPRATILGALGLRRSRRPARGSATAAGADADSPPRPSRVASATALARRGRLRPAVVLPIALVIIAIVVALLVAGVFGGGEPASVPQSFAPRQSTPSNSAPPPVVVMPGGSARVSAAAVERAKARSRAAKRRAAAAKSKHATRPAATAAPRRVTRAPAVTPPKAQAPARNPGAAAAPTRKAPSRSTAPAPGGRTKINADNGATGAEQLPPARDTSTVPELAPPVEPAPPPG